MYQIPTIRLANAILARRRGVGVEGGCGYLEWVFEFEHPGDRQSEAGRDRDVGRTFHFSMSPRPISTLYDHVLLTFLVSGQFADEREYPSNLCFLIPSPIS